MLWLLLVLLIASFTNAQVSYGTQKTGHITFYGNGADSGGTCMYNNPRAALSNSLPTVAIGNFGNAEKCGTCVLITPKGTGTGNSDFKNRAPFIAFVNNQCPECGENNLDLAETSDGIWDISWTFVDCPTTGNIELQLKTGSSVYWTEISARNFKVAISKMEYQIGSTWTALVRKDYNYFQYTSAVTLPVNLRLTSVLGEQKTITISNYDFIEPATKVTDFQFSGSGTKPPTTTPTTPTTPTTTPTKPTPTPTKPTPTPTKPTPTAPAPAPTSSGSQKCTYAYNDVWWVEFNAPNVKDATGPAGTLTCKDGKKYNCKLATWGTYQCEINQGVVCEAPRKATVGGVCCSLDATCASAVEEESSSQSQNNMNLPIGAIIGIVAAIAVVLVVLVVLVARKLRRPVMEHV
jgi:hypothetical protein